MTLSSFMKGGALGALAIAMVATSFPALASAPGGGPGAREDRSGERFDRNRRAERQERAQAVRQAQSQRQETRRAAPQMAQPRGDERRGRDWNRSDRRSETAQQRSGRDWNRSSRSETRAPAQVTPRNTRYSGDRNRSYRDDRRDGRTYDRRDVRDTRRDAYRDGRRDERQRDVREDSRIRRDAYRDGRRDGSRSRYYDGRRWHDYDRWDGRRWRDDRRYDWHDYRRAHRDIFRLGRYYAPYRNYRYNRVSIGFQLGSLFFGSRYWINDPWRYRLPQVYGPYRWVRYYDDVLLVDIYSGEVVDVIYDFFW